MPVKIAPEIYKVKWLIIIITIIQKINILIYLWA